MTRQQGISRSTGPLSNAKVLDTIAAEAGSGREPELAHGELEVPSNLPWR